MIRMGLLYCFIILPVFANTQEENKKLNLKFENKPLRTVLNEIKDKSGVDFIYSDDLIDKVNITFRFSGRSPRAAIGEMLNKYGISYRIFEKNSYVLFKSKEKKEIKNIYHATLIEQPAPNLDPAVILSKPKLISKMDPVYPPEAVRNNVEGKVNLKLFITKDGSVASTQILNSSGSPILDSAAVKHSSYLKFTPALENGEPQNIWILMIFKYQITGGIADQPFKN